ncbi:MAG: hypothetical protein NTV93_03290 [Verrucomicrobia bacterium]|nr:hypothetical protein [Verrucomicrobiota bacterium]
MKTRHFDELLADYRGAAIPGLPASFSTNVLREIRLRVSEAKKDPGWLALLLSCLRPGMVAASLSIALVVGVLVPELTRGTGNSLAAHGLGLDVFSTSNMPSGLLK